MNFISKSACLGNMLYLLVFYLVIIVSCSEYDGLDKFKRKKTSMGNYIHPSIFKKTVSTLKTSDGLENVGDESSLTNGSQASSLVPNSFSVPLIVRRFVNIILRKAVLKDAVGNTVQLESISDQNLEKLSMSLSFTVNPKELKTLREFGSNKQNLTIHQIDELLSDLFSNSVPPNHFYEKSWDGWWSLLTNKMDDMLIIEVAIFLCFIWILVRIIQGKSSWALMLFAIISSAVIWEKNRLLEEETIKSYSEQLRLANIPEHCHGIDNRSWWEKMFTVKPEDKECYEYHYHRLSKPARRVSYYQAFLNLFAPFLRLIVISIRELFSADKNQWFFSNWVYQAIVIPSFFIFLAWIFTIYIGGSVESSLFSFRRISNFQPVGSGVQNLQAVDQPKPPPRVKNGKKRKEIDDSDGASSSTFVFNIKGGSLNLNMTKQLPIVKKKQSQLNSKKEECESQLSLCPSKGEVSDSGETDSLCEESDLEIEKDLEIKLEDKNRKNGAAEGDGLAGGDTNIAAEKVLQNQNKED